MARLQAEMPSGSASRGKITGLIATITIPVTCAGFFMGCAPKETSTVVTGANKKVPSQKAGVVQPTPEQEAAHRRGIAIGPAVQAANAGLPSGN